MSMNKVGALVHGDAQPEAAAARSGTEAVLGRLESIITCDPVGRGLARDPADNLVTRCRGQLAGAAGHLAGNASNVAILTGFYVPGSQVPTIETDGPAGAILLASILVRLGAEAWLITDPLGAPALRAALMALPGDAGDIDVHVFPFETDDAASAGRRSNAPGCSRRSLAFVEQFFRTGPGGRLSHLIAVERAGPSHGQPDQRLPAAQFLTACPPEHRDQVHSFRGQIITQYTAKTHLLFDFIGANDLPVRTIGIGDGGNEIGMGRIPWQVIDRNVAGGMGARIACRVATDWTIVAGVSNWGAWALAAAAAWLRGRAQATEWWSGPAHRAVLSALVHEGGAVDGMTGQPTLSVDGIPLERHIEVWNQMQRTIREDARAGC